MPVEMPKLRVFISWAGKRAEMIGQGFHDFLPDVVNAIQPFISGSDIDKGTQWREVLTGNLQESMCEIVCLTPESRESVWVAFETGAISRAAGGPEGAKSRIWTYLLGLESRQVQLTPFAEYQATTATEADTFALIGSINALSPDRVSAESLKRKFKKVFWPNFSKVLGKARTIPAGSGPAPTASESELLSEVLSTVRSIQNYVRYQSGNMPARTQSLLLNLEFARRGRVGTRTVETAEGGLFIQVGKAFALLSPAEVEEIRTDTRKKSALIDRLDSENEPVDPLMAAFAKEVDRRHRRGETIPDAEQLLVDLQEKLRNAPPTPNASHPKRRRTLSSSLELGR